MQLFILSVLFVNTMQSMSTTKEFNFKKCCGSKSVMIKNNYSFECNGGYSNRYHIIDDYEGDVEYNNNSGFSNTCVEVLNDELGVFVFINKNSSKIFENVHFVSGSFHPKCCPVGFVYNSQLHSCTQVEAYLDLNHSSLNSGLSQCKIIVDYKFPSTPAENNKNRTRSSSLFKWKHLNILFSGRYCVDMNLEDEYVLRICEDSFEVCEETRCIHKCCADSHSFVNGSHCLKTYVYGINLNFSQYVENPFDDFAIVHGYSGSLYLQPPDWEYNLDPRGVFRNFDEKIGGEIYPPTDLTYCIEHATKNGINFGYRLFRKYPESVQEIETKYYLNGWSMVVSSVFLVLTIAYYILSNETRKLFGKTLVSFCVSLLTTFIILIYSTFDLGTIKAEKKLCYSMGFLLIYMEISSFLWLKLLCYDIYCTFGSGKIVAVDKRKKQKLKKFLFYSLYGWGLSLFLTAIPLTFFYVDVLPSQFQIQMGIYRCFIDRVDGNYADILFHTVPISIIETINIFLFIKTVTYCIQVKNEIGKINDTNDAKRKSRFMANKERLGLILKLFVIMGISYLFEVISSFYEFNNNNITKHIEMVWDVFNCLQGLFIFLIFVCKKKNVKKITNSAGIQKLRKISFSSANTNTTNLLSVKPEDKRRKMS